MTDLRDQGQPQGVPPEGSQEGSQGEPQETPQPETGDPIAQKYGIPDYVLEKNPEISEFVTGYREMQTGLNRIQEENKQTVDSLKKQIEELKTPKPQETDDGWGTSPEQPQLTAEDIVNKTLEAIDKRDRKKSEETALANAQEFNESLMQDRCRIHLLKLAKENNDVNYAKRLADKNRPLAEAEIMKVYDKLAAESQFIRDFVKVDAYGRLPENAFALVDAYLNQHEIESNAREAGVQNALNDMASVNQHPTALTKQTSIQSQTNPLAGLTDPGEIDDALGKLTNAELTALDKARKSSL
jgi:hypothetical protein